MFLQGQSCLRKCSSDEDCKSKKKHCLCDGLCGMSCVKPGKICIIISNQINIFDFIESQKKCSLNIST